MGWLLKTANTPQAIITTTPSVVNLHSTGATS
jgi:hypothetical protein